jgi:hypothetical protein
VSSRRVKGIRRGNLPTKHFAEAKVTTDQTPKNHTADAKRSMRKLRELLCDSGYRSNGAACGPCESPCRFGQEYLLRQKEGETL